MNVLTKNMKGLLISIIIITISLQFIQVGAIVRLIIDTVFFIISMIIITPLALKNIKRICNQQDHAPQELIDEAQITRTGPGVISFIIALFFLLGGIYNLKHPFLGASNGAIITGPFSMLMSALFVVFGLFFTYFGVVSISPRIKQQLIKHHLTAQIYWRIAYVLVGILLIALIITSIFVIFSTTGLQS